MRDAERRREHDGHCQADEPHGGRKGPYDVAEGREDLRRPGQESRAPVVGGTGVVDEGGEYGEGEADGAEGDRVVADLDEKKLRIKYFSTNGTMQ